LAEGREKTTKPSAIKPILIEDPTLGPNRSKTIPNNSGPSVQQKVPTTNII